MILHTSRLTLRPLAAKDIDTVHGIFTDEFIRYNLFDNEVISKEQALNFITTSTNTFTDFRYGLWLISLKEANVSVGIAGLWHFFDEPQPQLLYAVLPTYAHKGFATEASSEIINYFFKLGYAYLDASCDVTNVASHNTALRLGFKKQKDGIVDGKPLCFYRIQKTWHHW